MDLYGRASLEVGGGQLLRMHDISGKITNGAKVEHTFRKAGAGVSFGPGDADLTFQVKISSNPRPEDRDFIAMVLARQISEVSLHNPDGTIYTMGGAYESVDFKQGLEGAAEQTIHFVGVIQ